MEAFKAEAASVLSQLEKSPRGTFTPDADALRESQETLKNSLIGKLLGRPPPIALISRDVQGFGDRISVIKLAGGFFLFRFSDSCGSEAPMMIFTEGLRNLGGKLIKLVPWRPDFQAMEEDITSAPVWMRRVYPTRCGSRGSSYP